PCMSLMAHWIRPDELATKQSIWNASHSIGAGLISVICGFILNHYGYSAWQLCFAVPAAIALVGAFALYFSLRDTPSSVGLPEIEEMDGDAESKKEEEPGIDLTGKAFKTFVNKLVFRNPIIWILAVSNFCIYVVRFTILDWGATFLTQFKGMEIATAGTVVAASELVGGIAGMLLAGWFTDKFMKSRAHRTCLLCTIGATISFFLFWKTPSGANWLAVVFLCLSSFFVYGPQALLGIAASNQATKHACATANGILGIFGYASTTVSGLVFGFLADHYGWDSVFLVSVIIGIAGSIVIASMWNAPADGYEKASKIMDEVREEYKSGK
ncbi:MAG: MFS transporter, partial [Candidatus Cryptobacteroides sp.]